MITSDFAVGSSSGKGKTVSLSLFLIHEHESLRAALEKISANKHGLILATDQSGAVVGLATDGDIRSRLLEGAKLDDTVGSCVNSNFVWADPATPREMLLKQLDRSIRVIPLLNAARQLTGIVSRDHLPMQVEERTYARARSPVRISFGEGI